MMGRAGRGRGGEEEEEVDASLFVLNLLIDFGTRTRTYFQKQYFHFLPSLYSYDPIAM